MVALGMPAGDDLKGAVFVGPDLSFAGGAGLDGIRRAVNRS
ncbi:MAG: hypothetical protein ACREJQ_06685 [bacterium]